MNTPLRNSLLALAVIGTLSLAACKTTDDSMDSSTPAPSSAPAEPMDSTTPPMDSSTPTDDTMTPPADDPTQDDSAPPTP